MTVNKMTGRRRRRASGRKVEGCRTHPRLRWLSSFQGMEPSLHVQRVRSSGSRRRCRCRGAGNGGQVDKEKPLLPPRGSKCSKLAYIFISDKKTNRIVFWLQSASFCDKQNRVYSWGPICQRFSCKCYISNLLP